LQSTFPDVLGKVGKAAFYRAINRVQPSPIRVEADEVTYNIHVMLRFELETRLIDGTLAVDDVPAAWNAATEDLLGFTPPSDADGCLQDIHWSLGAMGYFPTYTLGTLMSVQLFEAAEHDLGDLGAHFERGKFAPLLGWLREHVHRHGRSRTADEILRDATGASLDAAPWLCYVRRKFGAVYGIDL
jgi:carboxypeptidase Taq